MPPNYAPAYLVTPDVQELIVQAGGTYPSPDRPWLLLERGTALQSLFICAKEFGFTLNLHFGPGGPPLPFLRGETFEWPQGPFSDGVYWSIQDLTVILADVSAVIMFIFPPR